MSDKSLCSIEGCTRPVDARGWCKAHHGRYLRHGSPYVNKRPETYMTAEERFWLWVDKRGDDECWPWTGNTASQGYGNIRWSDGKKHRAHRISWQLSGRELRPEDVLDHTCHNADTSCAGGSACQHRRCVNPAHLEVVDMATNTQRGRVRRPDYCRNGHPRTPENTGVRSDSDSPLCLPCRRATDARRAERKKSA